MNFLPHYGKYLPIARQVKKSNNFTHEPAPPTVFFAAHVEA
jgi:hypothetical protein